MWIVDVSEVLVLVVFEDARVDSFQTKANATNASFVCGNVPPSKQGVPEGNITMVHGEVIPTGCA